MSKEFGERLRRIRIKCEMTQQQVAAPLTIDRSSYSNYERGVTEPDIDTIVKLANIFNVSVSDILPQDNIGDTTVGIKDSDNISFYSLPNEEKELLAKFRTLTQEQKHNINRVVDEIIGIGENKK